MKKTQHFIARLMSLVMIVCLVIPCGVVAAQEGYTVAFLGNTTLKNELVTPYPKQLQVYLEERLGAAVNTISANPIDFDSDDFMNNLAEDVLPQKPDAVFLELDVSKKYKATEEDLTARLESMVLAMVEAEKVPAIYLIYFPEESMWDGRAPFQKVADRYELEVIDAFSHFKGQMESGKIVPREFLTAGTIPGEEGHDRLSRFAINELTKVSDLLKKPNAEAKPISSKRYTTVMQEEVVKEELQTDGLVLYVALNGSNNAAGTLEAPLGSIEEAQRRIRVAKQKEGANFRGATVYIRGGLYRFPNGLNFTAEDSGTDTAGIVYAAYEGEEVRFTNGTVIQAKDFKPVTDPNVLSRLHYKGAGSILEFNLKKAGITPGEFLIDPSLPERDIVTTNVGGLSETTLALGNLFIVNGKSQQRAQYPNGGWEEIADHQDAGTNHIAYSGMAPDRWNTNSGQAFIKMITNRGYWHWFTRFDRTDTEKRYLEMENKGDTPRSNWYWSVTNLLEELDIPGEWCTEEQSGMLYYYPREGFEEAELIYTSNLTPIVKMNKTKNITLEGITVEGGCYIGINIIDGYGNTIKNCTIRNVGNRGVAIDHSGEPGPGNNGVVGCHLYETALAAISIKGGDRSGLTYQNDYVVNNHIENFATYGKHGQGAIFNFETVGTYIRNNNIHNGNGSAILMAGADMYVEYNELYNVVRDTDDSGIIYDQHRGYVIQGKYINHNYFHDVWQSLECSLIGHVMGIYADETSSCGSFFENNVFYDVGLPVFANTSKNITIAENIMIDGPNNDSAGVRIIETHWNANRYEGPYAMTNNAILEMIEKANGDFEALKKLAKVHVDNEAAASLYYYRLAYLDLAEYTGENMDNYFLRYPWLERYNDSERPYSGEDLLIRNNGLFDYFDTQRAITLEGDSYKKYNKENYVSDKPLMQGETGLERLDRIDEAMQIMQEKIPEFEAWDVRTAGLLGDPKPVGDFELLSPKNGEREVATKKTHFFWDYASGADEYCLEIATDADFKNIVHSRVERNNYATVTGLKEGVRKYYWRVTAVSESDKFYGEPVAGPFSFTTERYAEADKGVLSIALTTAYDVLDQVVDGKAPGQYPEGTKAALESVIAEGEKLRSAQRATVEAIAAMAEKVNEAWAKTRASVNIAEFDAGAYFAIPNNLVYTNDASNAVRSANDSPEITFSDNSIKIQETDGQTSVYTEMTTRPYNIMRFTSTINFDKADGHWVIIGQGYYDYKFSPWQGSGYVVLIRKNIIELQAFKAHTGGAGAIYTTVPNDGYIKMGVPQDFEFATVPCEEGIRLIFRVDGEILFDYIDDTYPMYEPGHMMLHSLGNTTRFEVEPAMTDREYPSLYELLSDPESELNKK